MLEEIRRANLTASFREGGDVARANELEKAVAYLDRWVQERRAEMPEPSLGEMVRQAHRQLSSNAEYRQLIDVGEFVAGAQMIRAAARKEGGKLSHCWLTPVADELKAILQRSVPTTESEERN